MSRIARIVIPGIPHHVTQRGNRRQKTFFSDEDYRAYLQFIEVSAESFDLDIWSYCLMPNHVHLLIVPKREESLRVGIGSSHLAYTTRVNRIQGWTGHLWQGRFYSHPVEPSKAALIARYIELNPVRAGLCQHPCDYPWSSAKVSCSKEPPTLTKSSPFIGPPTYWEQFLCEGTFTKDELIHIRRLTTTGRPYGGKDFIADLERQTGRRLSFDKPGPKKNCEFIEIGSSAVSRN